MQHNFSGTFFSNPFPNVSIGELDVDAFKQFQSFVASSKRFELDDLKKEPELLLEKLRLIENGMLKRASLLLFHHDPEQFFTGAYIKIFGLKFCKKKNPIYINYLLVHKFPLWQLYSKTDLASSLQKFLWQNLQKK